MRNKQNLSLINFASKTIDKTSILLYSYIVNINDIKRKNLKRLIEKLGRGSQRRIATIIDTEPSYINNILQGRRNLSDEMIERICKALNIRPYEFYIEKDTPIVSADTEKKCIMLTREAENKGMKHIIDESLSYAEFRMRSLEREETKTEKRKKETYNAS